MNLNALLNMASNALLRTQVALGVVGHNVANVNTEGYSRQRVLFATENPLTTSVGVMGTGTRIESVRRQIDDFLLGQANRETSNSERWKAQNFGLGQLETLLLEEEQFGINNSLMEFWNAWADLANEPAGYTERKALISAAQKMAQAFQSRSRSLSEFRGTLDSQIQGAVSDVNRITQNIVHLNEQIRIAEAGRNVYANDLRDKRDALVTELAGYMDIQVLESPDLTGNLAFSVFLSDGKALVSGEHQWELSAVAGRIDGHYHDILYPGSGSSESILSTIKGGKLNAWLTLRDEVAPDLLSDLDRLAATVSKKVNEIHVFGYGLDGTVGNRFFELQPLVITGDKGNRGQVTVEGSILDVAALTLDEYRIEFVSETEFKVINQQTGNALPDPNGGAGDYLWSYTSGAPIRFDGLEIIIGDGTTPPLSPPLTPQAGDRFLVSPVQNAASRLAVSSEILADSNKIAAAGLPEAGDNQTALRIQALQTTYTMKDGTLTFQMFFGEVVGRVGVFKQQAQLNQDQYGAVMSQLTLLKESVSGVSLDEEMTQLLRFQYAFQASSRLIVVTDQIFQELMNTVKR